MVITSNDLLLNNDSISTMTDKEGVRGSEGESATIGERLSGVMDVICSSPVSLFMKRPSAEVVIDGKPTLISETFLFRRGRHMGGGRIVEVPPSLIGKSVESYVRIAETTTPVDALREFGQDVFVMIGDDLPHNTFRKCVTDVIELSKHMVRGDEIPLRRWEVEPDVTDLLSPGSINYESVDTPNFIKWEAPPVI